MVVISVNFSFIIKVITVTNVFAMACVIITIIGFAYYVKVKDI